MSESGIGLGDEKPEDEKRQNLAVKEFPCCILDICDKTFLAFVDFNIIFLMKSVLPTVPVMLFLFIKISISSRQRVIFHGAFLNLTLSKTVIAKPQSSQKAITHYGLTLSRVSMKRILLLRQVGE